MLKVGDKVKMTKEGFQFYANIEQSFRSHSVGMSMDLSHFTQSTCELFAIHGVGTIRKLRESGILYIRW
jgi:hypothetical protein